MKHASDEDLILTAWGERTRSAAHSISCARCRERLERVREFLAGIEEPPVPERDETYGGEVWRRIAPRLTEVKPLPAGRGLFAPASFLRAAAILTAIVGAFLIGRVTTRPTTRSIPGPVRERILFVAVGDHLERSQVVLLDFVNSDPTAPFPELARKRARDLLPDNRLYRQTAARAGDASVEGVLDELERVLLEIAHGPLSAQAREALRRRIDAEGVLFRVRVLDTGVRARGDAPPTVARGS